MDNKHQFLDQKGIEVFSREFFKKVDELIDGRIIKSVNENSLNESESNSSNKDNKGE